VKPLLLFYPFYRPKKIEAFKGIGNLPKVLLTVSALYQNPHLI
jgi:hypothetical protein